MKRCPRCETENPSKANFCLVCGASLGEEVLSEEIRLRKELDAANATIEVLKKSLDSAQKSMKNNGDEELVHSLQTQIETDKKTISKLKSKVEAFEKEIESLKHAPINHGRWGWVFVLLFIAISAVAYYEWTQLSDWKSDKNDWELLNQELKNGNEKLSEQIKTLELQIKEDNVKLQDVISSYPLKISDVEIANTYPNGDIETDYGNTLYRDRMMYLQPRIRCKGLANRNLRFTIKWYDNSGDLYSDNRSSPSGLIQTSNYNISVGDNELTLPKCGNTPAGTCWKRGSHRIEIWVGGVCLKSQNFYIN